MLVVLVASLLAGCSTETDTADRQAAEQPAPATAPPATSTPATRTEPGVLAAFSGFCGTGDCSDRAFPDAHEAPIPNWTGPVFALSQRYPTSEPAPEQYPWKRFNFRTEAKEYLRAVLDYALEGNLDVDWDVAQNRRRVWYHAPWMHWSRSGREFVHGLTSERPSAPRELAPTQRDRFQNWAVGIYNPPGGWALGRVWRDPERPDPSAARFPDGTVSIKLLFTQATPDQVPYLSGSKEWQANIHFPFPSPQGDPDPPRRVQTMRLLQVDVAVRDVRADPTTGWVFGTYVYSNDAEGSNVWDKLLPVGLMWGNDPGVTEDDVAQGTQLRESIVLRSPALPRQHLGYAGRVNGPVDNPDSSCLSCHSTAQWQAREDILPRPPKGSEQWMRWFRNIPAGEPFTAGQTSLDYSLQLARGMQNLRAWQRDVARLTLTDDEPTRPVTRGADGE